MTRSSLLAAAGISLAACGLAGCTETLVATRPALQPLDQSLTRRCAPLVTVPRRALTEREVTALWGADRVNGADCARRFAKTVEIVEARDAALGGGR